MPTSNRAAEAVGTPMAGARYRTPLTPCPRSEVERSLLRIDSNRWLY
ncbi:MAG: hypothetical protein ABJN57_09205 [Hyphomicrobiales bacterium]